MTRRSQSRRRRSYGRRQHEVRERRPGEAGNPDWLATDDESEWRIPDFSDERGRPDNGAMDGYGR